VDDSFFYNVSTASGPFNWLHGHLLAIRILECGSLHGSVVDVMQSVVMAHHAVDQHIFVGDAEPDCMDTGRLGAGDDLQR